METIDESANCVRALKLLLEALAVTGSPTNNEVTFGVSKSTHSFAEKV